MLMDTDSQAFQAMQEVEEVDDDLADLEESWICERASLMTFRKELDQATKDGLVAHAERLADLVQQQLEVLDGFMELFGT